MKIFGKLAIAAAAVAFAGEAAATEWNVSVWGKRRAFTEHVEKLAELVSEKTDGAFTLNIDYGGLSKNKENLDGISQGLFEMAQFCVGYHPGKTPTLTVMELPFLGIETLEQEVDVSLAVYSHPATRADLARWNATLLMPSPLPQYNLMGVGKPPNSLYSMRKLVVRATGGIAESMKVVKAEPIAMSATEVQGALEDGRLRAVAFAPHAHMAFGTIETATWWTTNLNPGTVHCPVVMNADAFEALPPEHKEALKSSVRPALDHYIATYNGATMAAWEPLLDEKEITRVTFNDSALGLLKEAATKTAVEPWIAKHEAAGMPARELLNLVRIVNAVDGNS